VRAWLHYSPVPWGLHHASEGCTAGARQERGQRQGDTRSSCRGNQQVTVTAMG